MLRGSPSVTALNGCYKIDIKTVFKWQDTAVKKCIQSSSRIYVEVDPPYPFRLFGKSILESTGSLAMSIALRQIENAFVQVGFLLFVFIEILTEYIPSRWQKIMRNGSPTNPTEKVEPLQFQLHPRPQQQRQLRYQQQQQQILHQPPCLQLLTTIFQSWM